LSGADLFGLLMKIGLFGGTFDPIHWGHLRSAEEVSETFGLDRVYFIPASIPPHKRGQTTTPAQDRLQMVRLAVTGNARFSVSTIEILRVGVSYSIDTIREFDVKKRKGDSIYFIIGLDAFREIATWKDFTAIFPLCNFIVTSRPGSKESDPLRGTGVAVKKLFCYDFKQKNYRHRSGTRIFFIELTDIAISASEIRTLVKQGKSIRYLVPPAVEKYIERRGLYTSRREER
jgi:nicotinate-nucleotide adenylyltransferase